MRDYNRPGMGGGVIFLRISYGIFTSLAFPSRNSPTAGLVYTAVIFNIFAFEGPVPIVRIKGRLAAFVGNDKVKTSFHAGRNTLPA